MDIGLDYILHSQRPPDPHSALLYKLPEASSMENPTRAETLPTIWWLSGTYFFKDMDRYMGVPHYVPVDGNIFSASPSKTIASHPWE